MNIKDIFFSKNSKEIRNFLNDTQMMEVHFHSTTTDFQFCSNEIYFDLEENPRSVNYFDYTLKKYYLRLLTFEGGGFDIFLTETDVSEELEIFFNQYNLQDDDDYSPLSLVLQENNKRDYRVELIIDSRNALNRLAKKFNLKIKKS